MLRIFFYMMLMPGSVMLDYGCALQIPGLLAFILFGVRLVIGVDVDGTKIRRAITFLHTVLAKLSVSRRTSWLHTQRALWHNIVTMVVKDPNEKVGTQLFTIFSGLRL